MVYRSQEPHQLVLDTKMDNRNSSMGYQRGSVRSPPLVFTTWNEAKLNLGQYPQLPTSQLCPTSWQISEQAAKVLPLLHFQLTC
jgi:hypothetical protein